MIYKGPLKKRGGTQSESAELQVFLFDHAILMVKQKSKNEQYKVYRKVRSRLLPHHVRAITLSPGSLSLSNSSSSLPSTTAAPLAPAPFDPSRSCLVARTLGTSPIPRQASTRTASRASP